MKCSLSHDTQLMAISGIRYYSFGGTSGYGHSAQDYMSCLLELGYEISWHPLCWRDNKYVSINDSEVENWRENETVMRPELCELILRKIEYSHVVLHVVPEYWPNFCEPDKVNIGYTTWEADELPRHWRPLLEQADLVLVPSEFNRKVFSAEISTPVKVVPHIIEPDQPSVKARQLEFRSQYDISLSTTVFYSINTWTVRKNMAQMLHAYLLAFEASDDVCLIIKTSKHGVRSRLSVAYEDVDGLVADVLANYDQAAKVVLIDDDEIPNESIQALHDIGDCYLSLSYGEGWGMGAAEAASAGNPVLITGWSGPLDFLGQDYPGLIDYKLVSAIDRLGAPSYLPHQSWARADLDDAIEKITGFYKNPEPWKDIGKSHKSSLSRFSSNIVAQTWDKCLLESDKKPT